MADARLSEADRNANKQQFAETSPCCIGERLAHLQRAAMDEHGDIDDDAINAIQGDIDLQQVVSALLFHTSSQTIPVELLFRRVRLHSSSNGGNVQTVATISSNHMLSETRLLHVTAK